MSNTEALRLARDALSFYSDETRYHGPNQRQDAPDKWSAEVGLTAYRLDVTRDRGVIAAEAIAAIDAALAQPAASGEPADHVPAGPDAEAATDAALGLVLLPPIRVDRATHAALQEEARARGLIVQAVVRERLAPYAIPGATAQPAPALVPLHPTVLIDWLAARYRAAGGKAGITDVSAWAEEVMRWTEDQHGIGTPAKEAPHTAPDAQKATP